MAYSCNTPETYFGKKVGNGQCVVFVQQCAGAAMTSQWKKGKKVKGNANIKKGTGIATFDASDRYPNRANGNHAAIFVSQDATGIWVYDQWVTKGAVGKRLIRFKGGSGSPSDDGDAYFVIE